MGEIDPLVGTTFGPCRLEALVGRGGMGRVYRGRHIVLDRVVAVKLVEGPTSMSGVLAEARAAAKLEDPRVVNVYEAGEIGGTAYIVMQWVDGETLEARVKRVGPIAPPEALAIMREAALALRSAHAAGIVHRDVKPGNIMVDSRGAVKLADFGIACASGVAVDQTAALSGSFHFMAPEQAHGLPPDPRSDLYALGATWLYILSGQPPFPGPPHDALIRHRDEPAPDVRLRKPEVTEKTSALIQRLMAKNLEDRPADVDALLQEMSSAGMLLDTDTSGSPFKILPPPPQDPTAAAPVAAPVAVQRVSTFIPPPPPPQLVSLGSRRTFFVLLSCMAGAVLFWPWRRAGTSDFLAGAVFLSLGPAFLTLSGKREAWRKVLGVLLGLGAFACFGRFIGVGGAFAWARLEVLILAGLGATCAAGSAYLAPWGSDRDEILWGRLLAPIGGFLFAISAVTWASPEGSSLTELAGSEGTRVWREWVSTGGLWRWGGLVCLALAVSFIGKLKTLPDEKAEGRKLNWNR